jgi:hypothetical protein
MGAPNTLPLTLRAPASPSIWFGSLSALEGRTGLIETYMDTYSGMMYTYMDT